MCVFLCVTLRCLLFCVYFISLTSGLAIPIIIVHSLEETDVLDSKVIKSPIL